VKLAIYNHLFPTLRTCRAIPPLPHTSSLCGAQLKHRDNFTFTFSNLPIYCYYTQVRIRGSQHFLNQGLVKREWVFRGPVPYVSVSHCTVQITVYILQEVTVNFEILISNEFSTQTDFNI